jgi:hypothetical protein
MTIVGELDTQIRDLRTKSAAFGLIVSSSACGEMLRIGRLDDVGTRATAARPTVLPIRILQLFPVAHLVYVSTMLKIRLAVARIWSLIVESESGYRCA